MHLQYQQLFEHGSACRMDYVKNLGTLTCSIWTLLL